MSQSFSGKSAIVTGAGSGIGRAVAHRLVDAGAHVVAVDLSADGLRATRADASDSARVTIVPGDVCDPAVAQQAVEAAQQAGELFYLTAAAGIINREDFFTADNDTWRRLLEVNVLGYVLFTRTVAQHMKDAGTGGSIALVASITGHISNPQVTYSTSKAAVLGFARSVAPVLAEHGIRINTVSPGIIHTSLNDARLSEAANRENDVRHVPLSRIGEPDDVARAILFLLGDGSTYVTGTDLIIDGGFQHFRG